MMRGELRRNPSADAFVVLVRRFDPSGEDLARWELVRRGRKGAALSFATVHEAKYAALHPPRGARLAVGDILTVLPMEYVSAIDERAMWLAVVTPDGVEGMEYLPSAYLVAADGSWPSVWGSDAWAMLSIAAMGVRGDPVDVRRLTMAACACARTALWAVPEGEDRPRLALEAAEAWCAGRLHKDALYEALRASAAYSDKLSENDYTDEWGAAGACESAAHVPLATDTSLAATNAATLASGIGDSPGTHGRARLAAMGPLVERWIPLPVVLLSRLGYPDAIPFDPSTVPTSSEGPRENPRRGPRRPRRRR
jgi:hypothetical protein